MAPSVSLFQALSAQDRNSSFLPVSQSAEYIARDCMQTRVADESP